MKHQKSINSDHVRRRNVPSPENEQVSKRLTELITPAVWAQQAYYRQLGMRARILTLPLMVAAVLTLIWRQVPSVCELARMLNRQDLLWAKASKVSRQALAQRFLEFPASVFERVLQDLLPQLKLRWQQRTSRPLPQGVAYALSHFERIWTADGSTLEALFRKLDSLDQVPKGQLAGKICTVIELTSRLPVKIWFHENPYSNDCNFVEDLLNLATAKTFIFQGLDSNETDIYSSSDYASYTFYPEWNDLDAIKELANAKDRDLRKLEIEDVCQAIKVATEEYWTTVSKWLTRVFPSDLDEVVISGGASRFLEPDLEKHFNCEHKYKREGLYPDNTYKRIGSYQPYDPDQHFTPMVWGAGVVSEISDILALDGEKEAENSLSYRLVDAYGLFDLLISKNQSRALKTSLHSVKEGSVA